MNQLRVNGQGHAGGASATRTDNALGAKIADLKHNAFTLLQEIKELSSLSFLDMSWGIDLHKEVRCFEIKLILRALAETDVRNQAGFQSAPTSKPLAMPFS